MTSKGEGPGIQKKLQVGNLPEETPAQLAGRPTYEEICQRAYEIFLERGGQHGEDLGDWLRAEQELKAKYRVD
jgi:hypothetical protein